MSLQFQPHHFSPVHHPLFSCGSELADLLVSSDLLDHSWSAISSLINDDGDNLSEPTATSTFSVKFKAYTQQQQQPSYTIIAFVSSPSCTKHHQQGEAKAGGEGEGEALVLSPTLQQNHPLFEFLCTKENPSLSINKEALTLFISLFEKLSLLNLQLGHTSSTSTSTSLIIITGHSLGGSVASLFALWLLENIPLSTTTNLPLCITFGSPLIGDDGLQRALSDRPTWNSRFLHLVSNQDLLPRLFISLQEREKYKPFGTFLMWSQLGCACFEDPVLVLELMKVATKGELQVDYGGILKHLKDRILYKGASKLHGLSSLLQAGIVLQLEAIGLMKTQEQQNNEFDSLIASMEQREQQNHTYQKRCVSYSNKKLNEMKINMALLEWYKKVGKAAGIGYYDCYKRRQSQRDMDVVKYKTNLSNYWKDMVREAERMPQKEGFFFRIRWLCAGTNYRRMVEPLDIADYCKKPGWKDYQTEGRSHHYKLLEKWLEEAKRTLGDQNTKTRNMASSLTEDSCFWAHVEEAINLTKSLNRGEEASQSAKTEKEKLMNFESYVMGLINNFSVSPEIFLEGSSFRQWWREYEIILEPAYSSSLTDFMRNHSYQQYT